MTPTLFLRPGLLATRHGRIDPAAAVRTWLAALGQAGPEAAPTPELLASWAALKRARGDLLEASGGRELRRQRRCCLAPEATERLMAWVTAAILVPRCVAAPTASCAWAVPGGAEDGRTRRPGPTGADALPAMIAREAPGLTGRDD